MYAVAEILTSNIRVMYFITETSMNGISTAASQRQRTSASVLVKSAEPSTRTTRIPAKTSSPRLAPIRLMIAGVKTSTTASSRIWTDTTVPNRASGSVWSTRPVK